jgi:integrase
MAKTVKHASLETPTARAKLKRGRATHNQSLEIGRPAENVMPAALAYQRREGTTQGRWLLRQSKPGNLFSYLPLGLADDVKGVEADGVRVLTYEQAKKKANDLLPKGTAAVPKEKLTVQRAFEIYLAYLDSRGQRTIDTRHRAERYIYPVFGTTLVTALTSERLRTWLAQMAAKPALLRSKRDAKKLNTKAMPDDDEAIRKRRSSSNRILTMLKAALNHAFDEGMVDSNAAWGRRVKPFTDVDRAKTRYLQIEESKRLLNAGDKAFRKLVRGALESGCRYGELGRMKVNDFNPDSGTLGVRKSKSHKARHVVLGEEGVAFFVEITMGRRGEETMFINEGRIERALEKKRKRLIKAGNNPDKAQVEDDGEWFGSEQARPMAAACVSAKLNPPINFHGLRHTWASQQVMLGTPLIIVAKNLGHKDTRMVEKHYGHLAPGFVSDAIRKGSPSYGFTPSKKVVGFKIK